MSTFPVLIHSVFILSLNARRRSSRAENLSLMILGCTLLVTVFIHSFSMVSGSLSSIMLTAVELSDFPFEAHTLQVSVSSFDDVYHLKCSLWLLVDTFPQLLYFRHDDIYQFALVCVLLVKPFLNSLRIFSEALNFFFDFIRQVGSQHKRFFTWFIEWFNVL